MRTILILEQGRETMIIPGSEMYKLLLGKGARVLDLMKTPPGHLALKVDEYGAAAEDKEAVSFTITANPQREDDPLLVKEASDPDPVAGTPAASDAHAYDVTEYQGHPLFHQRGDVRFHDPVFGE
eukprot:2287229-Pyramimonas_sp.AAC.1